ncbi:hypothetical protein E6O75_ATG02565 [Venturia nashicola]|uniref:Uncharacterized protein n=1 Tax=Venturia nashicola TaxID=86259 RepID=A0A4Z1PL45_9PEZI|nr:hypothetical protein E6O75_ATG02565 [Venturia nashicola]
MLLVRPARASPLRLAKPSQPAEEPAEGQAEEQAEEYNESLLLRLFNGQETASSRKVSRQRSASYQGLYLS